MCLYKNGNKNYNLYNMQGIMIILVIAYNYYFIYELLEKTRIQELLIKCDLKENYEKNVLP